MRAAAERLRQMKPVPAHSEIDLCAPLRMIVYPRTAGERTMNASLVLIAALAVAACPAAHAKSLAPASCEMHLAVKLTPDVPNPRDSGFLSSLLNRNTGYHLSLQRQETGSVIVLDLSGPGPEDSCRQVVRTMQRDGRVLRVDMLGAGGSAS
jgi:hypothetical protein